LLSQQYGLDGLSLSPLNQGAVMSLRKQLAVASVIFSLVSGAASAANVTFQFTGTVTYGGDLAATGSRITGVYSYDTKTLPAFSYAGFANYVIAPPSVIAAEVEGHAIVANNLNVSIWDNYGGNVEDMVEVSGGPVLVDSQAYPGGSFGFRLASMPGNTRVLTSTALPSSLHVRAFDAGPTLNYGWLQSDGGPTGQLLQFSVDSIVLLQKCDYRQRRSGDISDGDN
jgi:hypothetical protein